MKKKKDDSFLYLLLFGIIPSAFAFFMAYYCDRYGMHPVRFILCASPFLLQMIPYLLYRDWGDDDDKKDQE